MNRIKNTEGVIGVVIVDHDGITTLIIPALTIGAPIRSTLDPKQTLQFSTWISILTSKAQGLIRDVGPSNDLSFLRIRSRRYEIFVAPDVNYNLIVIQDYNVIKPN